MSVPNLPAKRETLGEWFARNPWAVAQVHMMRRDIAEQRRKIELLTQRIVDSGGRS